MWKSIQCLVCGERVKIFVPTAGEFLTYSVCSFTCLFKAKATQQNMHRTGDHGLNAGVDYALRVSEERSKKNASR